MSRSMIPSQQKLAEKLTILNERGQGMLTRIYNIKKMLGSTENKPPFLSDKQLEPALRFLLRKFPQIDSKAGALVPVNNIKTEIVKSLSLYYYTFVDIMDFKDHVADLLTTIDACQVFLDITINFDLCKNYLDLVTTYVSIMILVSKVEDRKAVLSLYNVAHEFMHGQGDPSFPRLGQMIIDYEVPMKKMSEEFVPHSRVLKPGLLSLHSIYSEKTKSADQMRAMQVLSLLAEPQKISQVPPTTTIQCDYLAQDVMERWIIFGLMLCYQSLQEADIYDLWKTALQSGYIVQLCRDEVLHIHSYVLHFFEGLKGQSMSKRVSEVKELQHQALQSSPDLHKERRKFLRTALKELSLIYTDQPGLLGPKALYVLQALTMAQNEVHWLLRHFQNPPSKRHNIKMNQEDFMDRQIPELLFYIEELKGIVKKYHQVMQRYYVQYLSGYDAVLLNQLIQNLNMCPEDESIILTSFSTAISALTVKQVEENEMFDFRGLRLDWFRLQAYTSVSRAALILKDHQDLAKHLNTIVFHTKMVDDLDEVINQVSDLSIYCFYTTLFENQFKQCMEFPAQHRFCVVFPMICSHFMNATHPLCPEERHSIGTTSVQYAHWFLKDMAEEVNQVITAICEEHCQLNYQLLPKHSVPKKRQSGKDKKKGGEATETPKPGQESARKNRENFSRMDKLHMALTELCWAINYVNVISVWEHGFVPREFFHQQLETRFNKMFTFKDVFKDQALVGMMMYNPETNEIAKPSELLYSVKAIMSVLQSIENYVHIDIARVFNNVLPQQTQPLDSFSGEKTITTNYANWYLEVLMRRVTCNVGQIIYSPCQKAFVSLQTEGQQVPFAAEEYADLTELRALAELIGPYGMKYMGEKLMFHVVNQVEELKKLVVSNREVLAQLRTSFDRPDVMRDLFRKLVNVDSVLMRMTIIGVLLSFRSLAQDALNDVLEDRVPFLMASVKDIHHYVPKSKDAGHSTIRSKMVSELASAAGLPCSIDPILVQVLRIQKNETADSEYDIACLLMVFVAVSIPKLARAENSFFKASVEGHLNNCHCLAKAVNQMAGALFYLHGPGDTEQRLQEFLALASSSLLRLGQESEKEAVRNRESVYLLLDKIVQESPFLTMDLLESCFPYALLRNAYNSVYKQTVK
ncbi:membrane-associated protein Hem-like isoform X3 [Dreissena polymorpha]|uniref:membrane-associated protein Hem-like isoform X3 n=1 Tax=Dreissena polymorpha TaxID=45954 RepID=UPI0022651F09|nr:membrane-associated protein Hem-like isoform X3 [Dreissena polymorpha]